MDHGLTVYGATPKLSIQPVDVTARTIIWMILGSSLSNPVGLYADICLEPNSTKRYWLARSYTVKTSRKLSLISQNSSYAPVQNLIHNRSSWPVLSSPNLLPAVKNLRRKCFLLFTVPPKSRSAHQLPPPWECVCCQFLSFSLDNRSVMTCKPKTSAIFNFLLREFAAETIFAYSDGSMSEYL